MLMRHAVPSANWMFFLDNEDWLGDLGRRFGGLRQSALSARSLRAHPTGRWARIARIRLALRATVEIAAQPEDVGVKMPMIF
jgi:hypothetical protein